MAEKIVFIVGIVLAVFVFVHSWYFSLKGKLTRKSHRLARWGVGFLVIGLISFYTCIYDGFTEVEARVLAREKMMMLVGLSGLWMLIGLFNIIRYFGTMYHAKEKK